LPPDERYAAAGAQDCTLVLWPLHAGGSRDGDGGDNGGGGVGPASEAEAAVEGGAALFFGGYERKVGPVAWDSSGRFCASAGGRSAVVWDIGPPGAPPPVRRNGRATLLLGHRSSVEWLGFAPAEPAVAATIVAAAAGCRVLLYSLDQREGGEGTAHAGSLRPVAECTLPDGRRGEELVLAWGSDGYLFGACGGSLFAWRAG